MMGRPISEEEEEKQDDTIKKTLAGNIKASLITNVFYLATRLCIPPFVLAYVSLAEYGLWSYCFIILSYLGMGVFGVTNVYVRYIAVYASKRKFLRINCLLSTGILSISAICGVLLAVLWFTIPWLLEAFHVTEEYLRTGFVLILGTTIIFMADLTIGAFVYVLQSLQLIVAEKVIWMISFTVESLLIILFLIQGMGIYSLLWAFAVRTAISLVFSAYVVKKQMPSLSLRLRYFSPHLLPLFFHFGGIVQLAGLLGIMNRSIKKVLAGIFIGLEATGLYEVGEKFPVMALNLPGSITGVFLPAASQFHATDQDEKIIQVYVRGSRLINILTGSMMGFMAAFSIPLIDAWLGKNPAFDVAATILTWFTIAYQMDTLTGPISAIYRAINQPQRELFYGFAQFILSVSAAGMGFYLYGPTYNVINITVSVMMVVAALIYLYFSNIYLNIRHGKFMRTVVMPGLYPYAIGYLLWWIASPLFHGLSRWNTLWLFLLCLVAYLAIWIPLLYWKILSKLERSEIKSYLFK